MFREIYLVLIKYLFILSKLEKSIETKEQEVVDFGKIVPSNNSYVKT